MPYATSDKLHRRRAQGVVPWELQFRCEDAALEGGFFRALDQGFPIKHVIFGDGTCGDTLWWVGGEVLVFVEKALLSDGGRHFRCLIDSKAKCVLEILRWQGCLRGLGINGGDGIIPGRWTRRGDTVGFRAEVQKMRLKKLRSE